MAQLSLFFFLIFVSLFRCCRRRRSRHRCRCCFLILSKSFCWRTILPHRIQSKHLCFRVCLCVFPLEMAWHGMSCCMSGVEMLRIRWFHTFRFHSVGTNTKWQSTTYAIFAVARIVLGSANIGMTVNQFHDTDDGRRSSCHDFLRSVWEIHSK